MASDVDTAEVLISEIQARPALWNSKLASYENKNLRYRLYAEVAESLGTSKTTVAAQWKNKKDKYRRELKKVPVLHSGDAAEHYKSNWPNFEIMSFLKDLLTPAVKFENLPFDGHSQKDITFDIGGDDEADTRSDIDAPISVNSPPSLSASNTPVREERQPSASCSSPISHKQEKGNRKRLCDVRDEKFIDIEKKNCIYWHNI